MGRWDITGTITMSLNVDSVITQKDEGYESYGSVQVVVSNSETGEVQTASVDYSPSKSIGEATAEAIKDASDKF